MLFPEPLRVDNLHWGFDELPFRFMCTPSGVVVNLAGDDGAGAAAADDCGMKLYRWMLLLRKEFHTISSAQVVAAAA